MFFPPGIGWAIVAVWLNILLSKQRAEEKTCHPVLLTGIKQPKNNACRSNMSKMRHGLNRKRLVNSKTSHYNRGQGNLRYIIYAQATATFRIRHEALYGEGL
jgi:hypothetical protein